METICETFFHSSEKSLWKLSCQSGLPYGSVQKAVKLLKLHPYWINVSLNSKNQIRKSACIIVGLVVSFEMSCLLYTRFFSPVKLGSISAVMWTIVITGCGLRRTHVISQASSHCILWKLGIICIPHVRIVGPVFFLEMVTAECNYRTHAVHSFVRGWWMWLLATTRRSNCTHSKLNYLILCVISLVNG